MQLNVHQLNQIIFIAATAVRINELTIGSTNHSR